MQGALERHPPATADAVTRAGLSASSTPSHELPNDPVRAGAAMRGGSRCARRAADPAAFAIGWDYAAHRIRLPDDAPEAVRQGHAAAAPRFATPKPHDRFVRKWLLLRYNAWLRRRIVCDEITPAYLEAIDVARCPVTREPLTHGTGADTDWSVDRLNNDGGYAPGNLAVISTRANRAKGTRGFAEVLALASSAAPAEGLDPAAWSRLASLMLGPCFAEAGAPAPHHPLVALAPRTVRTASQQLQLALLVHRRGGEGCSLGKLKSLSGEIGAAQAFHRLVKRIRRQCERGHHISTVFLDGQTFRLFTEWYDRLDARDGVARAEAITARTLERALRPAAYGDAWGLETLGYESRA
jgi:hypothetical protein